ncbi:hypothetical protein DBR32_08475 [Taibaiella sp. KBW10]|uniref:LiaF transmembrane domain-containing protein n=1 Tax=Taibaiella sp. KBW10 TaxID=2153357 RepID=UPI000F593AD2|nr:DUF5668 domain-containing protein [Taibaiella sp. KBW10]RQO30753.1 hypothetical protein DBR32_08475 [Taibaiella sp. KBW10]
MENQYNYEDEYKQPQPQPPYNNQKNNNNITLGIIIVLFGIFLFLRNTNIIQGSFFRLITSFPVFMIAGGVALGYKNNFKLGGWIALTIAGLFLFLQKININIGQFILPTILVGIGAQLVLKNRNKTAVEEQKRTYGGNSDDYVNVDSIFAGADRFVQTPNFRGGSVSAIFGGVKLDCKQANLEEDVILNLTVFCGGVELIVPANWIVVNDATTILGGIEDKRRLINMTGYEKRLILKGVVLCGGIDIKSY